MILPKSPKGSQMCQHSQSTSTNFFALPGGEIWWDAGEEGACNPFNDTWGWGPGALGPLMHLGDAELGRRTPQYMPGGTPKWQFPVWCSAKNPDVWSFHVGIPWHEVALAQWLSCNESLFLGGGTWWGGLFGLPNGRFQNSSAVYWWNDWQRSNLPKRSKMLHWNPFQAQDFQDVKGSLAMSCLGSLLHKDPIRTQPGWQLAQISHMQCVKTFAWLKSSGRFIYFETCSLYPIWDYSSPAICEGVQLRSNQLFFGTECDILAWGLNSRPSKLFLWGYSQLKLIAPRNHRIMNTKCQKALSLAWKHLQKWTEIFNTSNLLLGYSRPNYNFHEVFEIRPNWCWTWSELHARNSSSGYQICRSNEELLTWS